MRFPENWEQDLGAACQNILLEAVELGLGAVWLGIAPVEVRMSKVSEILNLPEHIVPFAIILIGYAKGEEEPKKSCIQLKKNRLGHSIQKKLFIGKNMINKGSTLIGRSIYVFYRIFSVHLSEHPTGKS